MSTVQKPLRWAQAPFLEIIRLSWPTILSLFSLSLMTFVDTLFIGRLGSTELAAAGLGGIAVFTVLSFGMSVFSAARVQVGEFQGRGDREAVDRSLGAFLRLAIWLGFASTAVGLSAALVLPALSADAETGKLAGTYAGIRALGFPIVLVGNAVGQWLQAQGNSQSAMRAALIANVANVPLNLFFIFGLDWGVAGAAWATAGSRLVEAGYLVGLQSTKHLTLGSGLHSRPGFHLEKSRARDSLAALRRGLPTGLERVLDMMAFAAVPLLLSQVGPIHVAAHQIVLQVLMLSFLPLIALSDSVTILISQAVGARAPAVISRLNGLGLLLSTGYGLLCGSSFVLLGTPLTGLFTTEPELRELAHDTLLIGAALQLFNAPYTHFKGVLRGLSAFRFVAWVTVGCAWLITPPLTYFWAVLGGSGAQGAWSALCVEVLTGGFICLFGGTLLFRKLLPS